MDTVDAPTAVRFENHTAAPRVLGIGDAEPRISWQVSSAPERWSQSHYELEIDRDGTQSYLVESSEQLHVPWPGPPLASRESARVRVRVRGTGAEWSPWSERVEVEAGLLLTADWEAGFISPTEVGAIGQPAPLLSGVWRVPDDIRDARLYVTALGVYELSLNGRRVGDEVLAPGWSSYGSRLRYQTHDVGHLLHAGDNEVTALLGNGWYRGRLGWSGERALYGDRLALLAQLEVTTASGERLVLTADESWSAAAGRVLADDLYDGQTTDLRPTGELPSTSPVESLEVARDILCAPSGPPVRVTQSVPAVTTWRSPSGALLVDFGQNLVGWVRVTARNLSEGQRLEVRHAEVLEDGELGTRPLRTALCTDTYVCATADEQVLEPSLTFHGFRYAQLDGVDPDDLVSVEAVVIGSDLPRTGWFDSSHELLNRFHENVVWGMRGNFVDVPTDCPQRDERLGWTGDIAAFAPTGLFLFDCAGLLRGWLGDLAADQREDGSVPFVVPDVLPGHLTAAAWGDAATLVPATLYERTGDPDLATRQLESMRAWVRHVEEVSNPDGLWAGGFQFGDWLDPSAPPDEPYRAKADPDVVATAYAIRSAEVLAATAHLAGDVFLAEEARARADTVREAFRREFVTPAGRVLSDAPTVYALALQWDLLDEEGREHAAARLADLVRAGAFRIQTGFVGTPLIADALAANGHLDVAYRLLLQTECPSWLYSVTMGATTVWERWDSMLPDGSINPGAMTSFNHYALGAVADFLHRTVAGLAPDAPGYRRIRIAPRPGGGLTRASARHLTPFGPAEVRWEIEGERLWVEAVVPVGATARVDLPGVDEVVAHGTHRWVVPAPTPRAGRPTTVRDLLDDDVLWPEFVDGVVRAGVGGMVHLVDAASVADRLAAFIDAPVEAIPDALTLGGGDPGRPGVVATLSSLGLSSTA